MPRSHYTPPKDAAQVFATRLRLVLETADNDGPLREMAIRELRGEATVGDLSKLTGMSREYFRKIARDEGIPLRRPPTVRPVKDRDRDGN